jgi:tetratricopeptide (TPR) repeat protein
MSVGLTALQRGDHAAALEAFTVAESLAPTSVQAAEGRARAEQGLRLDAIAGHRERALAAEAAEDWDAAGREYESVLQLDPTIRFAQEGKSRALERAELARRLNFHISRPERLATEGVLEDAATLVERAETVRPAGPVLSEQIGQLQRLVTLYETPVRIQLQSDSLTEVSIHRVGHLGRFDRRTLDLRPGTYTAVGRREGYRDVRRQFKVIPGTAAEPLVVRCEERI